ncbi:hypothetical protein FE257_012968 [Aspergillus nanangensis]|uniref:Extracellular membrane protein CFEM domain-containing protein n=1 Tax=Aspergillus nanangensis TaxID=2582783 RepID=A0AAD4CF37_ASPNN|nr:hypothetical protein FE257_012968 [Aspergillus nanangensis]
MKLLYTLLLAAASAMAASPEAGEHPHCALTGEKCNLSIWPPVECCPFHECASSEPGVPGAWGYCRKT